MDKKAKAPRLNNLRDACKDIYAKDSAMSERPISAAVVVVMASYRDNCTFSKRN
jgi:hypothetical protein